MKICTQHWDELRSLIDAVGLGALVATSGEDVANRMASTAKDGRNAYNFEPLMGAHNAILANCVDSAGPAVLMNEGCFLCYMIENCGCGNPASCSYVSWPLLAVEEQRTEAVRLRLVSL